MKYHKPNKTCSHCQQSKDRSLFFKNKTRKDGLAHWCIDCSNQNYIKRIRKWRLEQKANLLDLRQHIVNHIWDDVASEVI